jgi:hypothetical protein
MGRAAIDLAGCVFGDLTVIEQVPIDGGRNALWKCRCVCKQEVVTTSLFLRKGHSTSCGCKRATNMKKVQASAIAQQRATRTDEEVAIGRAFYEYRSTARKLGRTFALTLDTFTGLIRGACHYCGAQPFDGPSPRSIFRKKTLLNGIDRVDSKFGYEPGNVVSCCKHCNRAKLDKNDVEFIALCRRVAAYQQRGSA